MIVIDMAVFLSELTLAKTAWLFPLRLAMDGPCLSGRAQKALPVRGGNSCAGAIQAKCRRGAREPTGPVSTWRECLGKRRVVAKGRIASSWISPVKALASMGDSIP